MVMLFPMLILRNIIKIVTERLNFCILQKVTAVFDYLKLKKYNYVHAIWQSYS